MEFGFGQLFNKSIPLLKTISSLSLFIENNSTRYGKLFHFLLLQKRMIGIRYISNNNNTVFCIIVSASFIDFFISLIPHFLIDTLEIKSEAGFLGRSPLDGKVLNDNVHLQNQDTKYHQMFLFSLGTFVLLLKTLTISPFSVI